MKGSSWNSVSEQCIIIQTFLSMVEGYSASYWHATEGSYSHKYMAWREIPGQSCYRRPLIGIQVFQRNNGAAVYLQQYAIIEYPDGYPIIDPTWRLTDCPHLDIADPKSCDLLGDFYNSIDWDGDGRLR